MEPLLRPANRLPAPNVSLLLSWCVHGFMQFWYRPLRPEGKQRGRQGPNLIMRMRQSINQFELAFEQETALERRRREQLRKRAANRSRARRISRNESRGKVRFSVLLICLTITVVTVVVAMFETLAWLMG